MRSDGSDSDGDDGCLFSPPPLPLALDELAFHSPSVCKLSLHLKKGRGGRGGGHSPDLAPCAGMRARAAAGYHGNSNPIRWGGEQTRERAGRQAGWRMESKEAAAGAQGSCGREDARQMRWRGGKFGIGGRGRWGWSQDWGVNEEGGREEGGGERDQREGRGPGNLVIWLRVCVCLPPRRHLEQARLIYSQKPDASSKPPSFELHPGTDHATSQRLRLAPLGFPSGPLESGSVLSAESENWPISWASW